jgi:predicted dehydrogenase
MPRIPSLARRDVVRAPLILPASALGLGGATPPSDRITMAIIGAGPRGLYVLSHFLKEPSVRFVAACDCSAARRNEARQAIDRHYSPTGTGAASGATAHRFHEEVFQRRDVDAVLIATGDRWHSVLSVLAARAGKDIYCEKPISLTIGESRAMAAEIKRHGRVWQCGTQRKSIPGYRFVYDLARAGRLGKLHTITLSMGDGPWRNEALPTSDPPPDPEVFDYDRWLGQAPWAPYSKTRVNMWRLNWTTSGGAIADMGPHYCEFAQWVRGEDTGLPVLYEGEGQFRAAKQFNDTPYWVNVRARYADGTRLNIDSGPKGVRFDGENGWIQLLDEGTILADPSAVLRGLTPPEGNWKVMAPHIQDFLTAVRTRGRTVSSADVAHRAHTIVHSANLCLRLGRPLRWDPAAERFKGDDEANRMLSRPMRAPWEI